MFTQSSRIRFVLNLILFINQVETYDFTFKVGYFVEEHWKKASDQVITDKTINIPHAYSTAILNLFFLKYPHNLSNKPLAHIQQNHFPLIDLVISILLKWPFLQWPMHSFSNTWAFFRAHFLQFRDNQKLYLRKTWC